MPIHMKKIAGYACNFSVAPMRRFDARHQNALVFSQAIHVYLLYCKAKEEFPCDCSSRKMRRPFPRALCAILRKNNYEADAVFDGDAALEYLLSGNYDGAILDIMMPGADGIDVLRRLRAHGSDLPFCCSRPRPR